MNIQLQVNKHFKELLTFWGTRFFFIFGGYGSGKSYTVAEKLVLKALQEKRKILVTRSVFRTLRESCFDIIKEVVYTMGVEKHFKFKVSPLEIVVSNGSRFIFAGLDDPAKLKSINDVDLIWIEEASEISYDAFKELNGRLRALNRTLHIIMTLNPISRNNWVYTHFLTNKGISETELYSKRIIVTDDTYYHHSTVDDNKFTSEEYRKQLEEMETYDPYLYTVARLGHFGILGERVFTNVELMDHDKIIKEVDKINYRLKYDGLDFGFTTSFNALARMAIDITNNYLYIYDEVYNKNLVTSELITTLEHIKTNHRQIIADNARPETIEEIKRAGFRIYGSVKGGGSVKEGILKLKGFRKIIISDNCSNIYREYTELSRLKDKKTGEYIEDKFTIDAHSIDACRYGLEDYKHTRYKHGRIERPKGV